MTAIQTSKRYMDRRARAELLGGLGAGVLGAGLGLVFKQYLDGDALPLLVVGGTVHGVAMYQKHHLDASNQASGPPWTSWAYWACWLLLFLLAAYLWWSSAPIRGVNLDGSTERCHDRSVGLLRWSYSSRQPLHNSRVVRPRNVTRLTTGRR